MKRIVFTGDREWWPHYAAALNKVFKDLKKVHRIKKNPYEVIVGDCPSGVDPVVAMLAKAYEIPLKVFKADWSKYGRGAGPIRNGEMLKEENIQMVIACHVDLSKSKGTRNCVEQAKKKGLEVKRIGHWPF